MLGEVIAFVGATSIGKKLNEKAEKERFVFCAFQVFLRDRGRAKTQKRHTMQCSGASCNSNIAAFSRF